MENTGKKKGLGDPKVCAAIIVTAAVLAFAIYRVGNMSGPEYVVTIDKLIVDQETKYAACLSSKPADKCRGALISLNALLTKANKPLVPPPPGMKDVAQPAAEPAAGAATEAAAVESPAGSEMEETDAEEESDAPAEPSITPLPDGSYPMPEVVDIELDGKNYEGSVTLKFAKGVLTQGEVEIRANEQGVEISNEEMVEGTERLSHNSTLVLLVPKGVVPPNAPKQKFVLYGQGRTSIGVNQSPERLVTEINANVNLDHLQNTIKGSITIDGTGGKLIPNSAEAYLARDDTGAIRFLQQFSFEAVLREDEEGQ